MCSDCCTLCRPREYQYFITTRPFPYRPAYACCHAILSCSKLSTLLTDAMMYREKCLLTVAPRGAQARATNTNILPRFPALPALTQLPTRLLCYLHASSSRLERPSWIADFSCLCTRFAANSVQVQRLLDLYPKPIQTLVGQTSYSARQA
jgi:hypothetical protein